MTIEKATFTSSNLNAMEYDTITNTLQLRFNTGDVYLYFGVPQQTVNELKFAVSAGTYFHRFIRGKFEYKKK